MLGAKTSTKNPESFLTPVGNVQSWERMEGSPNPLGPTWIAKEGAYNFAIYSKFATSIELMLYHPNDVIRPVFTYKFDHFRNKTGRVWHARIPKYEMRNARYYGYAIDGPPAIGDRFEHHAFNPQKILVDPYAKSVFFPPGFDRNAALGPGDNIGRAPLGVLCEDEACFQWGHDSRPRHDSDLII